MPRKRAKTVIRTPFPTPQEVAKELGVSLRRLRQIQKMFAEIRRKDKKK